MITVYSSMQENQATVILRKFPNADLEAVQKAYPNADLGRVLHRNKLKSTRWTSRTG